MNNTDKSFFTAVRERAGHHSRCKQLLIKGFLDQCFERVINDTCDTNETLEFHRIKQYSSETEVYTPYWLLWDDGVKCDMKLTHADMSDILSAVQTNGYNASFSKYPPRDKVTINVFFNS